MDVLLALRNGNCYLRVRKTASDEIRRTVSFSFLSYSPTQALASNVTNRSVYMRQLLFSSIVRVAIGELGRAIQMAIGSLFGQFMGDNIKMRKWEQTTKSIGIIRFAIQWESHTRTPLHEYAVLICIALRTNFGVNNNHT